VDKESLKNCLRKKRKYLGGKSTFDCGGLVSFVTTAVATTIAPRRQDNQVAFVAESARVARFFLVQ
jgi:hypothetical protein